MRFVNVEKGQATEFKLDRMRDLASRLGNPQEGRYTIHIAGSKGKGSVSTMCSSILEAAGYTCGLYTSPHLLRWKERITLAGKEIPEGDILPHMDRILQLVEGKKPQDYSGSEEPTFFELTTLLAFLVFRHLGCNSQVIETGLGGRLDSTNILDPDVTVITPIELEHTQFLGDTIEKIAFEKAGIIKKGKILCVSEQKAKAMEVIWTRAKELDAPTFVVGKDVLISDEQTDIQGTSCRLSPVKGSYSRLSSIIPQDGIIVRSPLAGLVQAKNMALAVLACASTLKSVTVHAIQEGLSAASLPARFEIVQKKPYVVLDGAHTPDSIRLTLDTMNSLFPGEKILLFACAHDKKHKEMAQILSPHFVQTIITRPGTFKASVPDEVFESFSNTNSDSSLVPDTEEAIRMAIQEAGKRDCPLLVTGSFYLCAEVKSMLKGSGQGL